MHNHPGWLVDHEKGLVLENNWQIHLLGHKRLTLSCWTQFHFNALPRRHFAGRGLYDNPVHLHATRLNECLQVAA